jgi:hypothetical protein
MYIFNGRLLEQKTNRIYSFLHQSLLTALCTKESTGSYKRGKKNAKQLYSGINEHREQKPSRLFLFYQLYSRPLSLSVTNVA